MNPTNSMKSAVRRSSINKRALGLRKAARGARTTALTSTHPSPAPTDAHYTARVLAGEFEPTALRAREIAAQQGTSIHELAHRLGYAEPPPRVRTTPRLESIGRSELARATGYDKTDISRLFARRHPPTLTKLARVAEAYGAWMDDVLTALGW